MQGRINQKFLEYSAIYAFLKVRHFDSIVERLESVIVEDPLFARGFFDILQAFVIWPQVNLLRPIQNLGRDFLPIYTTLEKGGLAPHRLTLPFEVGSFLMRKLTFYPEGFEACKDVIQHYKSRDLIGVMNAFNEGAIVKDIDLIRAKTAELGEVFDNLWRDARSINSKIKGTRFLISFAVGIGGILLDPKAGLLASLGLYIADRISDATSQSISERIVKKFVPGCAVVINDFQNKYGLDRRPL